MFSTVKSTIRLSWFYYMLMSYVMYRLIRTDLYGAVVGQCTATDPLLVGLQRKLHEEMKLQRELLQLQVRF